jgi:hypothetical protein
MTYGTIKVDTVTFTNDGVDKSVTLSGLVQNPTFSGNVTVTGTLSGVTVTGTTANFTSGNFTNISGGTHTITSGVFAAGSAASPSIAFTGDLNTGIYSPGADQVAISTGGSGRLFVDASGRVGVGTSPSYALHVSGTGAVSSRTFATDATGDASFFVQNDGNGICGPLVYGSTKTAYGALASNETAFYSNRSTTIMADGASAVIKFATGGNNERLRITSAGLVGIGTSSPGQNITVQSSASGTAPTFKLQNPVDSNSSQGAANNLSAGQLLFGATGSYPLTAKIESVYNADASFGRSAKLIFSGANGSGSLTERLTIDESGRVGIGITTPGRNLHVAGSSATALIESTGSTNADLLIGDGGVRYYGIRGVAGGGSLQIRNDTANTTLATFTSTGLVGIGTTTPQHLLDCTSIGRFTGNTNSAASGAGIEIGYDSGNTTGFIQSYNRGSSTYLSTAVDGSDVRLKTSSTERARIDSSGRLLVGTSTTNTNANTKIVSQLNAAPRSSGGPEAALFLATASSGYALAMGAYDSGSVSSSYTWISSVRSQDSFYDSANIAPLSFRIADQEALRIDSQLRLLVGTSSSSAEAKFIVQGGATAAGGAINIQRNATTASAGSTIGFINFANSANNVGATISADGDGTWSAGTSHPTRLVFSTTADGASSPTERMRISSAGQTYVVSTYYGATIISTETAGTSVGLIEGKHSGTAGSITGATTSFTVWTNGNVVNTNNSYGAISDIKLKENIVDAGSQWDDIRALQIRKYNFKEGQTHTQIGLIAQEVELVSPGLVTESPDRDGEGNDLGTVTKSVNYSVLYMKAVKALQEAMERIETLEAKVAALESA